jgi:hypothetical protein
MNSHILRLRRAALALAGVTCCLSLSACALCERRRSASAVTGAVIVGSAVAEPNEAQAYVEHAE